ncbi:hypothetical protein [Niabella aurantiaca]|uniref:hypothetical protein n=1 Tax=Niabella aurantiaca TaxID=379900 RepID=UPI00037C84F1|nr:hypothetical protein [Niabella aurantiaca]
MKISKLFNLDKSQAELDFVDIDITKDLPLFLDPFFLGNRQDKWSLEATLTLKSFFQKLIDLTKAGKEKEARELFEFLHEPNSTCLGMSLDKPDGNGVGKTDTSKIYKNLLKSRAIQSGLLQDIEDNILFVDGFGKDKLSDMTTNIIRKHLIQYTGAQCDLHNIPLTDNVPSEFYWNRQEGAWKAEYTRMLVVEQRKILLVPKGVVSFRESYTPEKYYNHFVLNFLQNEHLKLNTALVKQRKGGKKYVTKKDIKETTPQTKEFLRQFTTNHPEVLAAFKKKTKNNSVKNIEISDISVKNVCKLLGEQLVNIPAGVRNASAFHNKILGILELIFYPKLIFPMKEKGIHQGRKRIDITFDNAADTGILYRLSEKMRLPCQYIFIECKNYTSDPENPELDQLAGRFAVNRGTVGFLICRSFTNRKLFIERCRDTYKDGRGLIIPLVDQDIINLLDNHNEYNDSFFDKYLSDIIREITVN